jgi:hypothetical protein
MWLLQPQVINRRINSLYVFINKLKNVILIIEMTLLWPYLIPKCRPLKKLEVNRICHSRQHCRLPRTTGLLFYTMFEFMWHFIRSPAHPRGHTKDLFGFLEQYSLDSALKIIWILCCVWLYLLRVVRWWHIREINTQWVIRSWTRIMIFWVIFDKRLAD